MKKQNFFKAILGFVCRATTKALKFTEMLLLVIAKSVILIVIIYTIIIKKDADNVNERLNILVSSFLRFFDKEGITNLKEEEKEEEKQQEEG